MCRKKLWLSSKILFKSFKYSKSHAKNYNYWYVRFGKKRIF